MHCIMVQICLVLCNEFFLIRKKEKKIEVLVFLLYQTVSNLSYIEAAINNPSSIGNVQE